MLRRSLLVTAGLGVAGPALLAACAAPRVRTASHSTVDATDLALLNRLTWGVDTAALAALNRLSRRDYLQAQLHPDAGARLPAGAQAQIDASPLRQKPMLASVAEMAQSRRDADGLADDNAKKAAQQAYQQAMNRLSRDAATEMLLRALYSPNQLQEQLSWFWFNHFNVHQYKSNLRAMVGDYQDQLRSRALGKFRGLLIASATHAAMIRYLDNEQNAANRINENFAREVMELHTLGVDGGYTQADVTAFAKVLTGWSLEMQSLTPGFLFREGAHEPGSKTLMGRRFGPGEVNGIAALDWLARHPATYRQLATKLVPGLKQISPFTLAGDYSRRAARLTAVTSIPIIRYQNYKLDSLRLNVDSDPQKLDYALRLAQAAQDSTLQLRRPSAIGNIANNKVYSRVAILGDSANRERLALAVPERHEVQRGCEAREAIPGGGQRQCGTSRSVPSRRGRVHRLVHPSRPGPGRRRRRRTGGASLRNALSSVSNSSSWLSGRTVARCIFTRW